jgi:hypothetical protein
MAGIIIKKVFSFTCPSRQAGIISRGSLFELKDHLISCHDLGFIHYELKEEGEKLIESAKIILNGYISFVNEKIEQKKAK